jgi:L-fuconolactonase
MSNWQLTRRQFGAGAVGGFLAVLGGGCSAAPPPGQLPPGRLASNRPVPSPGSLPAAPPPVAAIDCHTHFYDPTRLQGVPWPPPTDRLLYRPVRPAEYLALARPLGVVGTVVVEASGWAEDNRYVLDLAAGEPAIVGLCGNLTPGEPAFAGQVARFKACPLFRGIRVSGNGWRRRLGDEPFLADLRRLADADLQLDVNVGVDGLADVATLADRVPALRVVLNHCANVRVDGRPVPAAWLGGMTVLAKRPNVWAKVSGLVEGTVPRRGTSATGPAAPGSATAPADVDFYRPVLDWLWALFGEDRLVWGSNWPVSSRFAPLETVFAIASDYVASRGGRGALTKVFADNARVAYKWVSR